MQVISVPRGLRAAVAALALCLPLSALQIVLMRQAPWWRLPYARIAIACTPTLLLCVLVAWLLIRGRQLGWYLAAGLSAIWFIASGWSAIRLQNISMGFFTLFLGMFLVLFLAWLRLELGRSFFDPHCRWFEGLPKPIPGLECEVVHESGRTPFRVSRLDREGAFVFRERSPEAETGSEWLKAGKSQEIVFTFRDRQIRCSGVPIRSLGRAGDRSGAGFQFKGMTADARKSLGDFVESLKGEGYVL